MLCSFCGGRVWSRYCHFMSASAAILAVFGSLRVAEHALLTALHNTLWEVWGHFESSPCVLYLHVFFSPAPNEYGGPNTAILHTWTRNLYNLPLAKHSESPCKPRGQVFHWEPLSLLFLALSNTTVLTGKSFEQAICCQPDWFHRYYHWTCVKRRKEKTWG